MEDAGVIAVEAECIAEEVLEAVNKKHPLSFSLGSGMAGDVIMSFVADVCGEASEEDRLPKHAHAFGNVGRLHKQIHEERVAALGHFHKEVVAGNFPYQKNNIAMHDGEKDKFLEALDKWAPTTNKVRFSPAVKKGFFLARCWLASSRLFYKIPVAIRRNPLSKRLSVPVFETGLANKTAQIFTDAKASQNSD